MIATWYTNFLLNYDERVPTESGFTTISREGTERGSPDQAYPRARSNLTFDWGLEQFGATLGIRYISSVRETASESPNTMDPEWYVDTQVRYKLPIIEQRSQIAVGVTNIFGEDPPGCFSCGLNNFDPNTYDPPGRFVYVRVDYKE